MEAPSRPRALFVGITYAGWKTRQLNLERHMAEDGRLDAVYRRVTGWNEGGWLERVPGLPAGLKGRARAMLQARAFATVPRPDVTWTSCLELAMPYLWSQFGPLRRPLVVETDWTLEQQEAMAPIYFRRAPREGAARRIAQFQERTLFDRVTLFTPISNWAAAGLRRLGIEDERIHVLHPGLDLDAWRMPPRQADTSRPLRLLFVGGDFERKGGDMLVEAIRSRFAGRCELDVVTRSPVPPAPGVRVHRCEPNSPELRALYQRADLFVLPTRAECFGHASVEAMASGLPALVSDVGGSADIVDHGETGWRIPPTHIALIGALEHALANREVLPAMGEHARQVAERRFDGRRNDHILADLLLEQVERWRQPRGVAWRASA
ncbi:MAG: glycosyltransferase family 4 protein [Hyphomicrobiales bacterium]